jgi:sulfate adenylyltransferase subunit 1 (EFTu-like GTPase family)
LRPDTHAKSLRLNDIGTASIALSRSLVVDRYERNRETGSFILIDEATHQTVAAGMISQVPHG